MIPVKVLEVLQAVSGIPLRNGLDQEVTGVVVHSGLCKKGGLFVALEGNRADGHAFLGEALRKGAIGVLGRSDKLMRWMHGALGDEGWVIGCKEPLSALGEIAKVVRAKSKAPLVAVTGSSGKTTTKEMIACVLGEDFHVHKNPGNYNNALGVPLAMFALEADHQVSVLELGMSKKGEIAYLSGITAPDVGVLTNVQPAHLEGLGGLKDVMEAKAEILEGMSTENGLFVTCMDNPFALEVAHRFPGKRLLVSMETKADISLKEGPTWDGKVMRAMLITPEGDCLELVLPFPGVHLVCNAMLALAVGRSFGVSLPDGLRRLRNFQLPSMRFETRTLPKGGLVVFDAYNANPASMEASLKAFCMQAAGLTKVVVLGDMLELGNDSEFYHRKLGAFVAGLDLKAYAIGNYASWIVEGAKEFDPSSDIDAYQKDAQEDLTLALSGRLCEGTALLLKGSRGNKLEDVLARIENSQLSKE